MSGIDRIAIYGTSYGTKVALEYALRYPAHVERLALDTHYPGILGIGFSRRLAATEREAIEREMRAHGVADFRDLVAHPFGPFG